MGFMGELDGVARGHLGLFSSQLMSPALFPCCLVRFDHSAESSHVRVSVSLDTQQQFATRLWFSRVLQFWSGRIVSKTSLIDAEVALVRP